MSVTIPLFVNDDKSVSKAIDTIVKENSRRCESILGMGFKPLGYTWIFISVFGNKILEENCG